MSKSASTGRSREYEDHLKRDTLQPAFCGTQVTLVSDSNKEWKAQVITALPEGGRYAVRIPDPSKPVQARPYPVSKEQPKYWNCSATICTH
jgi:hypothetical protein